MSSSTAATNRITEEVIARRIQFVLAEAKCPNPVRDQTVTYAMRVISNFYSIGTDAGSRAVKIRCRKISREAMSRKEKMPDSWWKETINEHQEPLEQVWTWICKNKDTVTIKEIADRFKQWPMVLVTREEDSELRKRRDLGPVERYKEAGIEIVEVEQLSS